jgi:hypothetical protein
LVIVPAIRIILSVTGLTIDPVPIIILLKLVVPAIVASPVVALNVTLFVPVPGLKVPLLIHAPVVPVMVNWEPDGELSIPPVSIESDFMVTVGFSIGSFGVVVALGIITAVLSVGTALGVQFAAVVHESLTEPFHTTVATWELARVNDLEPNVEGKKATFTLARST